MNKTALKMVGISKYFPGVKALDQVHIEVAEGEILALLGENGAGKSTLMKVLAGVYQPDTGEIYIHGDRTKINGPRSAQSLGISIIYQEFNLIPYLSVAENIFLGREPRLVKGILDLKRLYKDTEELLQRVGLERISPKTLVDELTIAEQQLVEIAKALSFASNLIIMDEPTAALNDEDTDRLLGIMVGLKEQGKAIIFITHRLEEVEKVADRITVLRDGQYIGSESTKSISTDDMVRMMVGRDIKDLYPVRNHKIGSPVLKVNHLSVRDKLEDITFTLHEGEILGIGGLMGSGSKILSKALFGIYQCSGGTIEVKNQNIKTIRDAIDAGIALVTDDRKSEGLVLTMSVYENLLLPTFCKISLMGVLVKRLKQNQIVSNWVSKLRIKVHNPLVEVGKLSGGNQQKVVLGKWLQMNPKILILHEPTRGIDVGAKAEIYQLMKNLTEEGIAIILISSEMPELLGMSHRILVMHEGRITGELPIQEATQEKIFIYATGREVG